MTFNTNVMIIKLLKKDLCLCFDLFEVLWHCSNAWKLNSKEYECLEADCIAFVIRDIYFVNGDMERNLNMVQFWITCCLF